MPNPVVHFEVTGRDAKKLQDFYAKAFIVTTGEDAKLAGGIGVQT